MSKPKLLTAALATVAVAMLMAARAQAQAGSPAAGYTSVTVPPNSDAVVSVPFSRSAAYEGAVTSSADATHLTQTGAGWTAGEWTNTPHYVRMTSGASNGKWSTIVNNTTDTLELETGLTIASPNTYRIEQHWTLNNVFRPWLEGTSFFTSTPQGLGVNYKTQVLTYNTTTTGANQSAPNTYYYLNSAWRKTPNKTVDVGNTILRPEEFMFLRNSGTNVVLTFFALGEVQEGTLRKSLATLSGANDIYVGTGRPVTMTLAQLGLGGTAAFQSSTKSGIPIIYKDLILVYNNTATGANKSPADTYFYLEATGNVGWRKTGRPNTEDWGSSNVVFAAEGFVIRKAGGTPTVNEWSATAPY